MRGRKGKIDNPSGTISTAIYMGLVALTRIARNRVSRKTRRHYQSIEKMWNSARKDFEQGGTDFSHVQNAEPNMRGQFLKIVWTSTKRFGNKELKRVYSWLEGTVGPLNALLNYAGARLRDIAMTLYPFPRPQAFQIREYLDGSKRIFTKTEADEIVDDGATKIYWRYGYEREAKSPRIFLSHPTLPGLDFVDMIRAHCVELCRQCFIYHVPMTESHRYIQLLIHRLKPFLDWIYTDGRTGRPNFNPHADYELRKIVLEIRALYRKRSRTRQRISKTHGESSIDLSIEKIRKKAIRQLKEAADKTERKSMEELLDYIDTDEGMVADKDVEKLIEHVLALSQREGNNWHRILLSNLHHPVSLRQVVFSGDKMLDSLTPILVVAELPVAKRSGHVDLTIFIRREVTDRIIWTPVMVLEVKTKTAFDFSLYGMEIIRKRKRSVTPAFYAWKRALSEAEWNSLVTSSPEPDALQQLHTYEHEMLADYEKLVAFDSTPPTSLWKGVIVLDTDQTPIEIFPAFQFLLEELTTGLIHQLVNQDAPISVSPESLGTGDDVPRVGLLVAPSRGPTDLLDEMVIPCSLPVESPFSDREADDRILTLYVSIPSPTSSGVTAARLSRNWHLLHHIQECLETSTAPIEKVVWLDLKGDYKTDELVGKRFGLDSLLREKMISSIDHRKLNATLKSIEFLDLSANITDILTEGAEALDRLDQHVRTILPEEKEDERIIILDGWMELKEMVPAYQQSLVRALEQHLLDSLPQSNVNIIWIDSGTPHTRMNVHYQRKCVNPIRHDSPRRTHLDEVIYNISTTPWGFGWSTPHQENVRIIVQDTPTKAEPWRAAIHVPHLVGFAEKFRGLARRDRIVAPEDVIAYTTEAQSMYERGVTLSSIYASTGSLSGESFSEVLEDALTLVPSVLRSRDHVSVKEVEEEPVEPTKKPQWQTMVQTVSSTRGSTMGERLVLDVTRPPPIPRRGERRYCDVLTSPKKKITRRWFYELTPRQIDDEEESNVFTHTQMSFNIGANGIDTLETRELELRRLYHATRYLRKQHFLSKSLKDCCKRIEKVCEKQFALLKENPSLNGKEFFLGSLRKIQLIILEDPKRASVWQDLLPLRQNLHEVLNSENKQSMEEIVEATPDLLLLYGNNLFLAVLAAIKDRNQDLAEHLWNSVGEWTFYQLGMHTQDSKSKSVYSFQAILSNLRTRTKTLSQLNLPERATDEEQVGAIVWEESESGYDGLIIIPYDDGVLTGFIEGLNDRWIPSKWHQCVTAPQRLKEFAREALSSTDRTSLIVTTVQDTKILWIPVLNEYEELEWASFSLIHGKPSGRQNSIPWIKLESTAGFVPPTNVPEVPDYIEEALVKLSRVKHKTIPVKLRVNVNDDLRVYEVNIEGESVEERHEFGRTQELVHFLRTPIRMGKGYWSLGNTLAWDYKSDIDYDDDVLSFLKPLVHRSRFYPDEFHYPRTCRELLASTNGDDVTLVIRRLDSAYHVQMEDLSQDSSLRGLEEVGFDIFALALLAECKALFDSRKGTWHPVRLNANAIMDLRFSRLHQYPRFEEAIRAADIDEFDWSSDTWRLSNRIKGNQLVWSIISKSTQKAWMNKSFTFILTPGRPPDEELEAFRQEVESVIPTSYLNNLDDEFESHRITLAERYEEFQSTLDGAIPLYERNCVFRYRGLEIRKLQSNTVVIVFLEADEGDNLEVCVVNNVKKYMGNSQYASAISSEPVDSEVKNNLSAFDLEEDMLSTIREEVINVLEGEGISFYEL